MNSEMNDTGRYFAVAGLFMCRPQAMLTFVKVVCAGLLAAFIVTAQPPDAKAGAHRDA